MKKNMLFINKSKAANFLLLLIPFFIEKYIYINEGINFLRFAFIFLLEFVIAIILNYNNINLFKLMKKNSVVVIFLIVIITFVYSVYFIFDFNKKHDCIELYGNPVSDSITGPIFNEEFRISFSNVKLSSSPTSVCLTVSNYGKKISNSYYSFNLTFKDAVIKDYYVDASTIIDHDNYCMDLSGVDLDINDIGDYGITIVPHNVDINNAITLFKNSKTDEITMYFCKKKSINMIKAFLIIIYIVAFVVLVIYIVTKRNISVEKFYIITSVIYSFMMIFIIPPYQVPDEKYHFYNTIQQSQIDDIDISKHYSDGVIEVPDNINCLDYSVNSYGNKIDDYSTAVRCFEQGNNTSIKMDDRMISNSGKLGYIFTVIGVGIADFFTNSPMIIFILGRLFNCIISIIIIYFILKKLPKHKELFLAVALMPMFIQQMISYSYDSILNTVCLLLLCLSFILDERNINNRKLFTIYTIISLIIINIKIVYLPLFIFACFNNHERFSTFKSRILFLTGIIIISFGLSFFVSFYSNINFVARASSASGGNLKMLLQNPLLVLSVFKNTIDKFGIYYLNGIVGYFGWFSYKFSDIYIWLYLSLFIYIINNSHDSKITFIRRIVVLIICLIMIIGIFFALYMNDELNLGLNFILGIQGRYFLPIIIPLCYVFIPKDNNNTICSKAVYSFINMILFVYTIITIIYYY